MPKSTAPLTPLMLAALQTAKRDVKDGPLVVSTLTAASTFRGLLARELIERTGALTGAGLQIRHKALPPGADLDEEPTVDAAEELKLAGLRTMGSEKLVEVLETAKADGDHVSVALVELVINERLEAPAPAPAEDSYWTKGCGADVLETTRKLIEQDAVQMVGRVQHIRPEDNTDADKPLPRRVPAQALTQELTGEREPLAARVDKRPGYRAQVLLRPVTGEVVERASRETFVAVGAEWGRLEGKRVRIACMDGDVFRQRPLMILEAGKGELGWARPGDATVHAPIALLMGSTVLVDGCRVYQVGAPVFPGQTIMLRPVR